jgi:KDO2-lipid IV(A) lauroyltransferase
VSARQTATYLAYRGLGTAIQQVPAFVANSVAAVIGEAMLATKAQSREMAARNVRRVLASDPSEVVDDRTVRRTVRRAFHAYARYWVEGARLPALGAAEIRENLTVESGFETLERAIAAGRGVVLALPHVGSWEWGGAYVRARGYRIASVAEQVSPPQLFAWLLEQRRAMGLEVVPLDRAAGGTLLNFLRDGHVVALLCDRDIAGTGVPVRFFGELTTLPGGPATLALRTGAALMTAVVYRGPGHHHTAVMSPPIDTGRTSSLRADVHRVTQAIACDFERYIRRAPEQWHLFQPNWPSDRPDGAAHADSPQIDGAAPAAGRP